MNGFFKSFFGASGKEITGLSLLAALLLLALLLTRAVDFFSGEETAYRAADQRLLDSLLVLLADDTVSLQVAGQSRDTVFMFDPNTASVEELVLLGFTGNIAQRIINYRNKGGAFRRKNDLYKIYAIDTQVVSRLLPYIDLPGKVPQPVAGEETGRQDTGNPSRPTAMAVQALPRFDINQADTAMLQTIKGIGSVLAKRIIEFRDKLGGFVDEAQLYEVYNLDSIVVMRLLNQAYIDAGFMPRPLVINRAGQEELAAHPYISWQQARLIVAYRNQHGNFTSTADLRQVYGLQEQHIQRLAPYLDWSPTN